MKNWIIALMVVAALVVVAPQSLRADSVVWDFNEDGRKATATFDVSGSDLIVTLVNTSTLDVVHRNEVLTAVFFDIAGDPTLTPISALIPAGSEIFYYDSFPTGGDVGGEWAYRDDANTVTGSLPPGNGSYGISSVGLNIFGPDERFNPAYDLDDPDSPNGLNFGITSAGDVESTFQGGIYGPKGYKVEPLTKNRVTFTLRGLGAGFDPTTAISNVWFQYGTDLSEPSYGGEPYVPEPITLVGAAIGVGAVGGYLRKRRLATK